MDRQVNGRTDGQSDGQTRDDSIYRDGIVSHCKNLHIPNLSMGRTIIIEMIME